MPLWFILILILSLWYLGWQFMVTLVIGWIVYTYWKRMTWHYAIYFSILLVFLWWYPFEPLAPQLVVSTILLWMYWQRRKFVVRWREENA